MYYMLPDDYFPIDTLYRTFPTSDVCWTLQCWARVGVNGLILPTVEIKGREYTSAYLIRDFLKEVDRTDMPSWQSSTIETLEWLISQCILFDMETV
jgi:hypothetical protein